MITGHKLLVQIFTDAIWRRTLHVTFPGTHKMLRVWELSSRFFRASQMFHHTPDVPCRWRKSTLIYTCSQYTRHSAKFKVNCKPQDAEGRIFNNRSAVECWTEVIWHFVRTGLCNAQALLELFMMQLYRTLFKLHWEHCVHFWSPFYRNSMEYLEMVQRWFTQILPGLVDFSYRER